MVAKHNAQGRMRRGSALLAGLVMLSLLLSACGSSAKPKTYTIGVINFAKSLDTILQPFKDGMAKLGYVEGENVTYIYEGAVGVDKLDAVAQGLVQAKVDLIVSFTTSATKAVKTATAGTDIPVVFFAVTDPLGAGIITSLTKPGGNITGVTYTSQEGKRLEWLLKVAPTIKQIYIVYNPKDQGPALSLKAVREAAAKLKLDLIIREVNTPEDVAAAYKDIPQDVDAVFFLPDPLANAGMTEWSKIVIARKLPSSGASVETAKVTALTTYGVDLTAAASTQAAHLASRVLLGDKPAELPVEMADYSSVINLKIANEIGLTIPDDILRQANIVVR
jgi:putative tryptophan/tyrosine transport system substrate-binding protein